MIRATAAVLLIGKDAPVPRGAKSATSRSGPPIDCPAVVTASVPAAAGLPGAAAMAAGSLQPRGAFRQATIGPGQIASPHSLLALEVNGAPLSLDHGFPARIIVPALPGVHCTKWVKELHFT